MVASNSLFDTWRQEITHVLSLSRTVDAGYQAELIYGKITHVIEKFGDLPEFETIRDQKKVLMAGFPLRIEQNGRDPAKWRFWYVVNSGIVMCPGLASRRGTIPDWNAAKQYVEGYLQYGCRAIESLEMIARDEKFRYERVCDGASTWVEQELFEED